MENEFDEGERQCIAPIAIPKEDAATTTTTETAMTTAGEDGAASTDNFDYDTYATASALLSSALSDITEVKNPSFENQKPKSKKYRAPSPPRWRFVKVAKSTLGYSSTAAGVTVHGKSASELGAAYTPPIIPNEAKKEEKEVGELAVKGVGIMEFTKPKQEVGQLDHVDMEYSKFQNEQNKVGKLNIDEANNGYEELYEGGIVISHNAPAASHEDRDRTDRTWVNYAPRSNNFKDDDGDNDKDECTNLMESEDFEKGLQGEVGRLTFDPDDYLDETFDCAFPHHDGIEEDDEDDDDDGRGDGTYPGSTVRIKLPATTPSTLNDERQAKPMEEGDDDDNNINNNPNDPLRKSRLSRNILPVIAEGDVDDFASKSGTLESSTSSSNPRNPKFKFLLMLLPLLLAGAITGVVLGGKEEKKKGAEGDGVSAVGVTGSAVVLVEDVPSIAPSFDFGNSNLFLVEGVEEDASPSSMPSSTPSEYEYQGLFRPPAVTPSPEFENAVDFSPLVPMMSPAPTFLPTASSTKERSSEPSGAPSKMISEAPSNELTALPTNAPSAKPSASPTNSPSTQPSTSPSSAPSNPPSTSPSTSPTTSYPTTQPINFHGPCPKPFVPLSYYTPGTMVQFEGVVYECITYSCGTWGYEINTSVENGLSEGLWKEAWEVVGSCMGTMVPTVGPSVGPSVAMSVMPSEVPSIVPTRMVRDRVCLMLHDDEKGILIS